LAEPPADTPRVWHPLCSGWLVPEWGAINARGVPSDSPPQGWNAAWLDPGGQARGGGPDEKKRPDQNRSGR
jgi:hypothetical protein